MYIRYPTLRIAMKSTAKNKEPQARQREVADPINIRVPSDTLAKIDFARRALGKTRTDFILETARERAENVILDQRIFELDEARSAAFVRALNNPPTPADALRALMASKAPWE
jgi:uncharacterized protein (DUF1778 family)